MYDPNDYARTTVKEQLNNKNYTGQVDWQKGISKFTVYDPNDLPKVTEKEQIHEKNYTGQIDWNNGISKHTVYDPSDVPGTTTKEQISDKNIKYQVFIIGLYGIINYNGVIIKKAPRIY